MSYTVLSLKWRPQKFEQIEGQKPVQKILTNAIKSKSLHHALIFSGPKGTGKTSTARILAKALLCEEKKDFEPCNQCSSCLSIQDSNNMDVIEIDGASNNSVDTIRDLRESVQYMPTTGDYRIYIIDEVHMLSQSAFNALLKTLEEPPAHVQFILATTELRKIPPTVSSRCQIFHFRPIANDIIQKKLQAICKEENIQIEDEALWIITQQSQNSMRDAQVLLDQMACLENKKITAENIRQVLGLTQRTVLNSILKSLVNRDTKTILSFMDSLSDTDSSIFLNNLLMQIRNLLMIKLMKKTSSSLVFLMEAEKEFLQELSKSISNEDLHLLFDMCLKGNEDIKKSSNPNITLEMVLLRMSQAPHIESLIEGESLSPAPGESSVYKSSSDKQSMISSVQKNLASNNNLKQNPQTIEKKSSPHNDFNPKKFENFIQFVQKKEPKTATQIKSFSLYQHHSNEIVLGYPKSNTFLKEKSRDSAFQTKLEQYLLEFFEKNIKCRFVVNEKDSLRAQQLNKEHKNQIQKIKQAQSHPLAQQITNVFQAQVQLPQKPQYPK